jgi:hypothetical protein
MNTTAADFINNRILRHAAQLRPGYTASPELQQNVLDEWSALADEWNVTPDMTPSKPQYSYPIIGAGFHGNNRDYQLGPTAADMAGPRPVRILKANLLVTGTSPSYRIPLQILPWRDEASIPVLAVPASGVTQTVYVEETFPNAILHFWPPISGGAAQFEFWTEGVLVAPPTLATVIGTPTAPVTTIPEIFNRTALIYDSTIGNNIAPVVTVYASGTAARLTGVLRKAIASNLTLRVNVNGAPLITATIPAATPVDTVLSFTVFSGTTALTDGQWLSFDITASDSSKDTDGIAAFTLSWGPATTAPGVTASFPPGYENAFVYELAKRIQYLVTKEMGPWNPNIGAWALRARQKLQNLNRSNPRCRSDFQTSRRGGVTDFNVTLMGDV